MSVTPIAASNGSHRVQNKQVEAIDDKVLQQSESPDPAAEINAVYYAYLIAQFYNNLHYQQDNSPYVMKVETDW